MTDATVQNQAEPVKSGKMPLIIGFLLALVGGGSGFFAASSGMILAPESKGEAQQGERGDIPGAYENIVFVPMEPLTISLPRTSRYNHLRFRGELEVAKEYAKEVETLVPRIVDVLNSYLRALEVSDIEVAASLIRLRSQMLRRVQIVAGPGRINDLLIMEFVLN